MSSDVWTASEQGNLALIQAVKRHPCLYNNTLPEYSQKDVTNAAWQEIAQQFGCSAFVCKKQWMRLRSAYSKDERKRMAGKKKPHRFVKYMEFIAPYRIKNQQNSISQTLQSNVAETLQNDVDETLQSYVAETLQSDVEETLRSNVDETLRSNVAETLHKKINEAFPINASSLDENIDSDSDLAVTEFILLEDTVNGLHKNSLNCVLNGNFEISQTLEISNDNEETEIQVQAESPAVENNISTSINSELFSESPRMRYLLSLWPEIDAMTEAQFRAFKRKILGLIDDVRLGHS